jgi:hypothetical protein
LLGPQMISVIVGSRVGGVPSLVVITKDPIRLHLHGVPAKFRGMVVTACPLSRRPRSRDSRNR